MNLIIQLVPWLELSHTLQKQTNRKKVRRKDGHSKEYKVSYLKQQNIEEQV